jgi:hypothetical protein
MALTTKLHNHKKVNCETTDGPLSLVSEIIREKDIHVIIIYRVVSTKYLPVKSMSWTLISAKILEEVQLMIVLGIPPLTSS